jgi:hypothetical protein
MTGFSGVLNCQDRHIPVFDLFIHEPDLQNMAMLVDLPRFARWDQYVPMDEQEDHLYISEFLYVRVADLNADDERREALIRENPPWLQAEAHKERFLRQRVVLNIYEKFKVQVLDPSASMAWKVTRTNDDAT